VAIAGVVVAACAIVISRRPDAFTNPQFFAEDGSMWFSDAYNHGPLAALDLATTGGYLQTASRLGAVLAAPFGVANAPLVFNICGLLLQIAPALFLLSRRFDALVPSIWPRLALSGVYLLMPSAELNVNNTFSQFHLAILAALVIIAPEPRSWGWRAFDLLVAALCGLTGPFAYVLFPISVLWLIIRRRRFTVALCVVFAVTLGLQLYIGSLHPRPHYPLGASLSSGLLIIGDRVILAGVFAQEIYTHVLHSGEQHSLLLAAAVCLLALPVVAFALLKAPAELWVFGLIAGGLIVAGLASPFVSASGSQWQLMATADVGDRYFFMAQVAWVAVLFWAVLQLPRVWMRRVGLTIGTVAFASGLAAWQYPPFVNYDWPAEAHAITSAAPGTREVLPINPGGGWAVVVTVK
jgi:hypothetical protein